MVHLTCQESVVRTVIVDSFPCVVGITWRPVAMLFDSLVVTTSKLPDAIILAISEKTRQRGERRSFGEEQQREKAFLFVILGAMLEHLCRRETSCSLSLKNSAVARVI